MPKTSSRVLTCGIGTNQHLAHYFRDLGQTVTQVADKTGPHAMSQSDCLLVSIGENQHKPAIFESLGNVYKVFEVGPGERHNNYYGTRVMNLWKYLPPEVAQRTHDLCHSEYTYTAKHLRKPGWLLCILGNEKYHLPPRHTLTLYQKTCPPGQSG
jgi:hypothetical protein